VAVTEAERIWGEKSDEDLLDAAGDLDQFTADGQRIVRAELKRRGLEDPVEQVGGDEPGRGAAPAVECLRCNVPLRLLDSDPGQVAVGWTGIRGFRSLVELSDSFDVYVCPQCGHVDLFVQMPLEETPPE
jgi:hypothetical protein